MDNKIIVNNVFKSYKIGKNESAILKDINIEIKDREFVSIMGPSGSGKSTLLYILGTLEKVTSGKIILDGEDISIKADKELSAIRRKKYGFIYQSYNLVKHLNILENILLPIILDNKKSKEYIDRAKELIDLLGLNDKMHNKPKELSGGQQQRVAIGRALINNPDIILADEPIGNLDSENGKIIMGLLQKLNIQEKKTIVQVTHSLESAKYGDRVINIRDGRIIGL